MRRGHCQPDAAGADPLTSGWRLLDWLRVPRRRIRFPVVLALAAAFPAIGCVRDGVSSPDAGGGVEDGGVDAPSADAGPWAPNDFEGPIVFDDARLDALDPATLPEGRSPCRAPILARVTDVTDGDTFSISGITESLRTRVRIIGVDAPEIAHADMPAQCYGNEAAAFTRQLVDHHVWLTFDATCFDPFDRLLAYVHIGPGDGDMWERQLLRRGLARTLTIRPNDTFSSIFASDQGQADLANLGLWGACP